MEEIKNQIVLDPQKDITWKSAQIEFKNFALYKNYVENVAELLNRIVLTEDNVKDVKHTLANARKITKQLNDARIHVKKEILSPYKEFEEKIKELTRTIDTADETLRSKVRDMEEKERTQKGKEIRSIWDERLKFYHVIDYTNPYVYWIKQEYLNKSTPMKAIEKSMTDWLEQTEKELRTAEDMDKSSGGNEYTCEYLQSFDFQQAIETVNQRKKMQKKMESVFEHEAEENTPVGHFVVTGKKDIEFVKMLLKENEIEFEFYM